MPGLHHNIFGYYRGPSGSGAGEQDRVHRQVEDNTTKALINVLEHSAPDVLRGFLDRFVPELVALTRAGHDRHFLQRGPTASVPGPRYLLAISPQGEIAAESWRMSTEGGSRVDASIQPGRGGLLVIEVKTASELDGAQLLRHAAAWSIEPATVPVGHNGAVIPTTWRLAAWSDVWRWAIDAQRPPADNVSVFLLNELTEYLEILGLAPWGGFRPEDFKPVATSSYEQRVITKNRLRNLWTRILEQLGPSGGHRLGRVEVSRLHAGAEQYSAITNRGENGVRFSLELDGRELRLNVVASQARAVGRLEAWLATRESPPVRLEVVIGPRQGSARRTVGSGAEELARFSLEELLSGAVAFWREQWAPTGSSTAFAYRLRRAWSREEVLGRGEGIADEVASDVQALLPLLAAINRWE